jgi:hypothetical protein
MINTVIKLATCLILKFRSYFQPLDTFLLLLTPKVSFNNRKAIIYEC